jgi:hypothetical protein
MQALPTAQFWNQAECKEHGTNCFSLTKGTTKTRHKRRCAYHNTKNTAVPGTLHLPSATNPLCKHYFLGMRHITVSDLSLFILLLSVIHCLLTFISENAGSTYLRTDVKRQYWRSFDSFYVWPAAVQTLWISPTAQ